MKYKEDKILEEIQNYIKSTYGEHYSTTKDGFQVQDMLRQLGIDKDFCQANAIKYLCRYGKKDGKNRKDLLKAIHYVILLLSSEDADKEKLN
jgi:superfamily I DNA/RNA helicase